MKIKTTRKEMKEGYSNIIGIGYCQAQYLLSGQDDYAYISGKHGWACDIYKIDNNTIISTGYQPIRNTTIDYNTLKVYEREAEKIVCESKKDWDEKKKILNQLLLEMIQTAKVA